MAFARRTIEGMKQLKDWVTTTISTVEPTIRTWATITFASKNHTHVHQDITNFPNSIPDYTRASDGYTTAMRIYKTPSDGWIYASGRSSGGVYLAHTAISNIKSRIRPWEGDHGPVVLKGELRVHNNVPYQARETVSNGTGSTPHASNTTKWAIMNWDFPIYIVPITSHTGNQDGGFGSILLPCKAGTTCMFGCTANDNGFEVTLSTSYGEGYVRFISSDRQLRELIDTGYTVSNSAHSYNLLYNKLVGV